MPSYGKRPWPIVPEFLSRLLPRILSFQNLEAFFALAFKYQFLVITFLHLPADLLYCTCCPHFTLPELWHLGGPVRSHMEASTDLRPSGQLVWLAHRSRSAVRPPEHWTSLQASSVSPRSSLDALQRAWWNYSSHWTHPGIGTSPWCHNPGNQTEGRCCKNSFFF